MLSYVFIFFYQAYLRNSTHPHETFFLTLYISFCITHQASRPGRGGGGGGGGVATLLWHIVCAAPKVYSFLRRFVLKTGIDSAHFGLEFEETRGVFNRVLIPNE